MKTHLVSEELGEMRWPRAQSKSLKTGGLPKSRVGYDEGRKDHAKMKVLPRMCLKINEIQN
jgi:hypothetical protein